MYVTYDQVYGDLPTVSAEGHSFEGWYTDSKCSGDKITSSTIVTNPAEHTLYAKMTGISYTVDFSLNGHGTVVPPSQTVVYGNSYGSLQQPTCVGYTFSG